VKFGPTSGWDLLASLRHPCKFQRVLRLGSVTARHSSSGRQPKLWHWAVGATYIRQGGHHFGHWPTFLVCNVLLYIAWFCIRLPTSENLLFCTQYTFCHGPQNLSWVMLIWLSIRSLLFMCASVVWRCWLSLGAELCDSDGDFGKPHLSDDVQQCLWTPTCPVEVLTAYRYFFTQSVFYESYPRWHPMHKFSSNIKHRTLSLSDLCGIHGFANAFSCNKDAALI